MKIASKTIPFIFIALLLFVSSFQVSIDGISIGFNIVEAANSNYIATPSLSGNETAVNNLFINAGTIVRWAIIILVTPIGLGLIISSAYMLIHYGDPRKDFSLKNFATKFFVAFLIFNFYSTLGTIGYAEGECSDKQYQENACAFTSNGSGLSNELVKKYSAVADGTSANFAELLKTAYYVSLFISSLGAAGFAYGLYNLVRISNGNRNISGGSVLSGLVSSAIVFDHLFWIEMALSFLKVSGFDLGLG